MCADTLPVAFNHKHSISKAEGLTEKRKSGLGFAKGFSYQEILLKFIFASAKS